MISNATELSLTSENNGSIAPTEEEDSSPILIPSKIINLRRDECYKNHVNNTPEFPADTYCPWTFDGWSCWNNTPVGVAYTQCPDFIPGFDPNRKGHKICTANATWFRHPLTNQTWSNYTNCVDLSALQFHRTVNLVYTIGYSASLAALLISLCIFLSFRSLKCKRVTIHKNLFSSFIINNCLWLVWHFCITEDPSVVSDNGVACQILHIVVHYFLVSNYLWMFCEGLYLHTILVVAFLKEDKIILGFLLVGWGVPALLVIVYACARASSIDDNKLCWMEDSPYNYILSVPVVLSMIVNFFFLVNIVRVLVTKLRAVNTGQDSHSTRKAVRATLILIPLLGVHYVLTPFKPPSGSTAEPVYLVATAAASSFQGLAVSFLFCFFNGEVVAVFKKKWDQHRLMVGSHSHSTTTKIAKNHRAEGVALTTNGRATVAADM